uniref:PHD-type domain-containing protein n=1 Tax=Tetradesmus obliquus TaxID=3088 RepID=A0A383VPI7_TETOB|eukprot:jgi/Sobl393_1/11853/SZX66336.1
MTENGDAAAAAAAVADAPAAVDPAAAAAAPVLDEDAAAAADPAAAAAAAAPDPAAAAAAPVDAAKPAAADTNDTSQAPAPAAAARVHAAAAAAAAAAGRPQPPSLEQCKVLQAVIRLLEHHEDARKMLPLAAMSAETLQLTLTHSPQPINVADVLSKLMPHLEPAVAHELWEQFKRGSVAAAAAAAANGAAAAAPTATAAAILSQAAPLAPGAANPAHAKLRKQAYAANNAKCSVCAETYHPSFSPLLLCDFCPQAHHVYCLGLDWPDLPEGEWACPSCLPLPGGQRNVIQQQRLLALQREQQMRLKAFAAGAAADKERRKADEKLAKEKLKEEQKKADSKRAKGPFQVDDMDLAMEEAAEAARLTSLMTQLQDAAEREGGGGRRGSAAAAAAAAMPYEPADDAAESEHRLPPLPPNRRIGAYGAYGAGGGGGYSGASTASEQLREASDKLRRLQATAAGPPALKDTITDERQLHSLMDALAVAEFLSTFAGVCGAPLLGLAQLQQAAAWPLDGPELFETYSSLVKYLLAQWSHIESGHVGARVRRWARCLERSSAIGSFDAAPGAEGVNGMVQNGNATWQELLRRYCLLSRSSLRVKDSELKPGQCYASMTDDLIMVHAAVELGKQDAWRLPPEFHLRLLHALCNDVVNCFNMKAEISSRLDTSIALQIEKFHADAEERKKEKEAARMRREAAQAARDKRARELSMASTPADGGTPDPQFANSAAADGGGADGDSSAAEPPLKRARSSSGLGGDFGGVDGTPGLGGDTRDGTPDPAAAAAGAGFDPRGGAAAAAAGWRSAEDREARDAALSAELARYSIRSEPLGMDRHHQRYWHMQSLPSIIFVESAEGDSLGLITNRSQLDALMAGLNKRGSRESALHQVLQKRYDEFCRCLRPPHMPLDVAAVPRNRRSRRNWLKAAARAMPANVKLDASGWPLQQQQQQQQDDEAQPDYQQLLAASEATAVAASLSELEGLVSGLVGAGIYDLSVKDWRARLRGKTSVDELCQMLEEFEAALSQIGDGRPAGATEEAIDEFIREADIYEAEFVMPVSAAELAEQQEAAAAAAAAAAAEKAAAAAADGGDGGGDDDACEPPALAAAAAAARPPPPSNKKGKKAAASSSKKGKGSGGSKAGGSSKKGGKKGSAAASAADGDADDDTNPDAAAHRGPMVTLFSGATRVRKAGHMKQEQQQVKQEAGEPGDAMQVDGAAAAAVVKSEQEDGGAAAAGVKAEQQQDEDVTKMVSPLEELDDSDVEAEKRYQEKRAAEKAGEPLPPPPVVLWRSARELGVWVKDLRRARTTGALGGAAYAAAALVDRAHRLMSNLALSRIRTGVAAAIAEDRQASVRRKELLLLGPAPWEEALGLTRGMLDAAAEKTAAKDNTIVTSTGRRIKGTAALQEPRRKMSARQRSKRGGSAAGSDDEAYWAAGGGGYGGDEYGDYYGGYEEQQEEAYSLPEGRWGLECCVCGGSGPEVACCEVPGCSVLMHLGCAGMPDADFYYCPDHCMSLQQPWLHAVPPPDKYPQPHAPPVKPNAT